MAASIPPLLLLPDELFGPPLAFADARVPALGSSVVEHATTAEKAAITAPVMQATTAGADVEERCSGMAADLTTTDRP